jgi:hypothetical protein
MPTTAKIPAIDPTAGSVSSLPTLPDGAVPQAPHVLSLGRLERCDLKTVWAHEAFDFTPWLAQRDSLQLLGDTLGLDLEPEAIEEPVGPFRADILCRDVSADQRVIIENQLGRTDHGHLGQLMTYAAGLEAVTIIWIAASFTDEHRAALDWLNRISADSVRLFGLEVELWRIGSSPAAPRFSVVAKPNGWSRSVARAARALDDGVLSELRQRQQRFWADLNTVLDRQQGPVGGNRRPQSQAWMTYPIGRSEFHLTATMLRRDREIRAEMHIMGEMAKPLFQALLAQRQAVERDLNHPLEWEELPSQQDCRVAVYLRDVDPEDESDWPRQHEWLATQLNDLHRVFAGRIKRLGVDGHEYGHES